MEKLEDIEARLEKAEKKIDFLNRRRKRAASYFATVAQENVRHVLMTENWYKKDDSHDQEDQNNTIYVFVGRTTKGKLALFSKRPIRQSGSYLLRSDSFITYLNESFFPGLTYDNGPIHISVEALMEEINCRSHMKKINASSREPFNSQRALELIDSSDGQESRSPSPKTCPAAWPFIPQENELVEIKTPNHDWAVGSVYTVDGYWIDLNMSNGDRIKVYFDSVNMTKGYGFRKTKSTSDMPFNKDRALKLVDMLMNQIAGVSRKIINPQSIYTELCDIIGQGHEMG